MADDTGASLVSGRLYNTYMYHSNASDRDLLTSTALRIASSEKRYMYVHPAREGHCNGSRGKSLTNISATNHLIQEIVNRTNERKRKCKEKIDYTVHH